MDLRHEFGHWDVDLMMFECVSQYHFLTERKSRYTALIKKETRNSSTVMGSIRKHLKRFSKPIVIPL